MYLVRFRFLRQLPLCFTGFFWLLSNYQCSLYHLLVYSIVHFVLNVNTIFAYFLLDRAYCTPWTKTARTICIHFLENPLTIRTYCAIIILSAGRKVLNAENPVSRLGENDTEGVNDMSETAEVICQLISWSMVPVTVVIFQSILDSDSVRIKIILWVALILAFGIMIGNPFVVTLLVPWMQNRIWILKMFWISGFHLHLK